MLIQAHDGGRSDTTIGSVGPWALLALGVVLLLAIGVRFWKHGGKEFGTSGAFMIVFGTLLSGLGTFGIDFMDRYSEFLNASGILNSLQTNPSEETYETAYSAIASGELQSPYREAALSMTLENPIDGTSNLLSRNARRATNEEGKVRLEAAQRVLRQKEATANELTESLASEGKLTPTNVEKLDPSTRFFVSERVSRADRNPLPGPGIPSDSVRRMIELGRRVP